MKINAKYTPEKLSNRMNLAQNLQIDNPEPENLHSVPVSNSVPVPDPNIVPNPDPDNLETDDIAAVTEADLDAINDVRADLEARALSEGGLDEENHPVKTANGSRGIYMTPREDKSGKSSAKLFFRELGSIPFLTQGQLHDLGTELEAARKKVDALRDSRDKDGKETPDLVSARNRLNEVQSKYVIHHLRLVVSVARRYDRGRMELMDLIQEGTFGLRRAVKSYDPKRGYKFATYATWWIRHSIRRALDDKSRLIRLPAHITCKLDRYEKTRRYVSQMGLEHPERKVDAKEFSEISGIKNRDLDKLKSVPGRIVSLYAPLGDDDGSTMADIIADPEAESTDEAALMDGDGAYIGRLLSVLNPKEEFVIRQRYGFRDGGTKSHENASDGKTLEEIGREMNLTRERIRQIQDRALGKMKRAISAMNAEMNHKGE